MRVNVRQHSMREETSAAKTVWGRVPMHKRQVPCPSPVLCERAGLLEAARFPLWNRVPSPPAFFLTSRVHLR